MDRLLYLLALALLARAARAESNLTLQSQGCHRPPPSAQRPAEGRPGPCVGQCAALSFAYAFARGGVCLCANAPGEPDACAGDAPAGMDAYRTGARPPGAPRRLQARARAGGVALSWLAPESLLDVQHYRIVATVERTFASFAPAALELRYPNDTLRATVEALPASRYNISVAAVSSEGAGPAASVAVETKLGDFEYLPEPPKIINNYGTMLEIKISEVVNNNGPISSYLVVVVNQDMRQFFQEQLLKSFYEARSDDTNYYITAELKPNEIFKNFMVGDGKYYGRYLNVPLQPGHSYNVIVGVVSSLNGEVKKAFSTVENSAKMLNITPLATEGDSPALIIGLSIAIAFLSVLLVFGIIGFLILKSRVTNRRQRLSNNQELTLQGPMIEVENNGYIPEEEPSKAGHYLSLKQKLRVIPHSQIKIDPKSLLGIGRFGRVNHGAVNESTHLNPVAVYSIHDKKLAQEDRKSMLMDLDVLIRCGKHENAIALVGTCETPQLLLVALEYVSMNLKDLLLGSRDSLPGRFSNMNESEALQLAVGVANGMAHLEGLKIIHRQLCARNILVSDGSIPKISGFGLAQYYSNNNLPDYTRWTALEVFKGQAHTRKSDVWAFGCVLWEVCVLGGTPYGNVSNNEIPERIMKGLRLPQMMYFNDDIYQIMLNCWQVDLDERPTFNRLIDELEALKDNTFYPYLKFNLYSNFQYEQFYPDMEIAVRPVF